MPTISCYNPWDHGIHSFSLKCLNSFMFPTLLISGSSSGFMAYPKPLSSSHKFSPFLSSLLYIYTIKMRSLIHSTRHISTLAYSHILSSPKSTLSRLGLPEQWPSTTLRSLQESSFGSLTPARGSQSRVPKASV